MNLNDLLGKAENWALERENAAKPVATWLKRLVAIVRRQRQALRDVDITSRTCDCGEIARDAKFDCEDEASGEKKEEKRDIE